MNSKQDASSRSDFVRFGRSDSFPEEIASNFTNIDTIKSIQTFKKPIFKEIAPKLAQISNIPLSRSEKSLKNMTKTTSSTLLLIPVGRVYKKELDLSLLRISDAPADPIDTISQHSKSAICLADNFPEKSTNSSISIRDFSGLQKYFEPSGRCSILNESLTSQKRNNTESLKRKLLSRTPAKDLIERGILQDSLVTDQLIAERANQLKRCKLVDSLNDKLAHRPGPLELVKGNILHVDESLEKAVKDGLLQFKPTKSGLVKKHPFLPVVHNSSFSTTDTETTIEPALSDFNNLEEKSLAETLLVTSKFPKKNSASRKATLSGAPICHHRYSEEKLRYNTDYYNSVLSESLSASSAFDEKLCKEESTSQQALDSNPDLQVVQDYSKLPGEMDSIADPVACLNSSAAANTPNICISFTTNNQTLQRPSSSSTACSSPSADHANNNNNNGAAEILAPKTIPISNEVTITSSNTATMKVNKPKSKKAKASNNNLGQNGSTGVVKSCRPKTYNTKNKLALCKVDNSATTVNVNEPDRSIMLADSGGLSIDLSDSACWQTTSKNNPNETSYQLLLQQQQLMLQWQMELKQKYPNANLHFVTSSNNDMDQSGNMTSVDFIDIDASPIVNNNSGNLSSYNNGGLGNLTDGYQCNGFKEEETIRNGSTNCSNSPTKILCSSSFYSNNGPANQNGSNVSSSASTSIIEKPIKEPKIPEKLEDLKVHELKSECKRINLLVSGSKQNLIDRLRPNEADVVASVREQRASAPRSPPGGSGASSGSIALNALPAIAATSDDVTMTHCAAQQHPNVGGIVMGALRSPAPVGLPPISFLTPQTLNDCANLAPPSYAAALQQRSPRLMDHCATVDLTGSGGGCGGSSGGASIVGVTSPSSAASYNSPGVDLSALTFGSSPSSVASSASAAGGNNGCFATVVSQQPSTSSASGGGRGTASLYDVDRVSVGALGSVMTTSSGASIDLVSLAADVTIDCSGNGNKKCGPLKSPIFSLHEDMIKTQQSKIDELQRELQRSQNVLKQQQLLILAAKKAQAESVIIETPPQQLGHNFSLSSSHNQFSSIISSASSNNNQQQQQENILNQLDTKQMQKIHIQTYLQQKLQQQQLQQQLNVQRELVATQQRLEEEMQAHQAVSEVVKLLRQEPKVALLVLHLLKRHQLEQRQRQTELSLAALQNNTFCNGPENNGNNASNLLVENCNNGQFELCKHDGNSYANNGALFENSYSNCQKAANNTDPTTDLKSPTPNQSIITTMNKVPTKQKKLSTSSNNNNNNPAQCDSENPEMPKTIKPKRPYRKNLNGRTEAAKYARQKASTCKKAAQATNFTADLENNNSIEQTDSATVISSSKDSQDKPINNNVNGLDTQNVDMEDIFRSVLDYASKKNHPVYGTLQKNQIESIDSAEPNDFIDSRQNNGMFTTVSSNANNNMLVPVTVGMTSSDLFVYTKNEAFDDLMEVLQNNGAPDNAALNLIGLQQNQNINIIDPVSTTNCSNQSEMITFTTENEINSKSRQVALASSNQQFSMNAFSAQDMADLLSSDWFNVDSILGHANENTIAERAQLQNSVSTPPATNNCNFTMMNNENDTMDKMTHSNQNNDLITEVSDPMDCWFDMMMPGESVNSPIDNTSCTSAFMTSSSSDHITVVSGDQSITLSNCQTPPLVGSICRRGDPVLSLQSGDVL